MASVVSLHGPAPEPSTAPHHPPPTRTLDALNFFLADVRDGLGPYLAIYLLVVRGPSHGWNEATVGMVLTIAGIVGLLSQTPAGGLIDRATNKPRIVIVAALLVTLSSLSLPVVSGFAMVTLTQSIAAAAGALFAPAISAISLGIVGPKMFARRVGRNEAFNHAGNAVSAALAGALAWRFGPVVVFWLMAGLTIASIAVSLRIDNRDIDNAVARGLDCEPEEGCEEPSGWRTLVENRPLMIFAAAAFTFHLANAAMLTSVSQLLGRTVGTGKATSLTAACIVAAQLVMVPVAILVGRHIDRWGTKPIFLLAFGFLAARGALYTVSNDPWWLVGVQAMDGIGAGIFGALFPVVVADLTQGSGRFNVSQGVVSSIFGLGAALSATLAGSIIVRAGYAASFLTLAGIAAAGFVLYLAAMPETSRTALSEIAELFGFLVGKPRGVIVHGRLLRMRDGIGFGRFDAFGRVGRCGGHVALLLPTNVSACATLPPCASSAATRWHYHQHG